MSDIIISKYEQVAVNGKLTWYAVDKKGKRYEMPDAYAEMYNENYLAIAERTIEYFADNETPKTHYVPKYTGKVTE